MKHRVVLVTLFGFLFISSGIYLLIGWITPSFEDGTAAFDRKDYKQALVIWTPYANEGKPNAQYNLGLIFDGGLGVPKDTKKAVSWYSKAARQGHIGAQINLGTIYAKRGGELKSLGKSVTWLKAAADRGHRIAQYNLSDVSTYWTDLRV